MTDILIIALIVLNIYLFITLKEQKKNKSFKYFY